MRTLKLKKILASGLTRTLLATVASKGCFIEINCMDFYLHLRQARALHRWLGAWIREQERRKGRKR